VVEGRLQDSGGKHWNFALALLFIFSNLCVPEAGLQNNLH
jgi:hypothetical protein